LLEKHHLENAKPGELGLKFVMTEYELDRWYANMFGIDITAFPPYRPAHIIKEAYEYLKKYANFNRGDGDVGEGG